MSSSLDNSLNWWCVIGLSRSKLAFHRLLKAVAKVLDSPTLEVAEDNYYYFFLCHLFPKMFIEQIFNSVLILTQDNTVSY